MRERKEGGREGGGRGRREEGKEEGGRRGGREEGEEERMEGKDALNRVILTKKKGVTSSDSPTHSLLMCLMMSPCRVTSGHVSLAF